MDRMAIIYRVRDKKNNPLRKPLYGE